MKCLLASFSRGIKTAVKQEQFCTENTISEDGEKTSIQTKVFKGIHVLSQKLCIKIIYHNISASSYEIFIPGRHKLEAHVILPLFYLPYCCVSFLHGQSLSLPWKAPPFSISHGLLGLQMQA